MFLDRNKIINSDILQRFNGLLTNITVMNDDWVLDISQNWDGIFFIWDENAQVSVGETSQSS